MYALEAWQQVVLAMEGSRELLSFP
jgi:hypothetical protein